jgi:hypothetical protein
MHRNGRPNYRPADLVKPFFHSVLSVVNLLALILLVPLTDIHQLALDRSRNSHRY